MKKTYFRSFIYSFVISLSVLFVMDRAHMHAKSPKTDEIIIPDKNITLFLKDASVARGTKTTPVKTIALSVPEIKKEMKTAGLDVNIPLEFEKRTKTNPVVNEHQEESVWDGFEEESTIAETIPLIEEKEPLIAEEENFEFFEDIKIAEAEAEIPIARESKETEITQTAESIPDKGEIVLAEGKASGDENALIPIEKKLAEKDVGKVNIIYRSEENQLAMASNDFSAKAIRDANESQASSEDEEIEQKAWETMVEKKITPDDSPWVVAKSTKFPKNNIIKEEDYYKDMSSEEISAVLKNPKQAATSGEVKLAADIVQNILIPIPEDIMKEENLTPQLITSKEEKASNITDELKKEIEETSDEDKKSILQSLSSIFGGSKQAVRQVGANKQPATDNNFFDQITRKIKGKDTKTATKILPTEMRLSFQPNRAEISGQTLKWLHAFAKKTTEDNEVILEVRIDGTRPSQLQQKRLNLLNNILRNKGVSPDQVNVVFTEREPNSFIIRTLRIDKDTIQKKKEASTPSYYQQW